MDVAEQDAAFAARIVMTGDPEADHSHADDVLVEALRAAGFNQTADAFERCCDHWWYA